MKRLSLRADACSFSDLRPGSGVDLPSECTFSPVHYEPNYSYPLMVWLHGPRGEPSDLLRVMPWISLRNYVGVAVRGTQWVDAWDPGHGSTWGDSVEDFELSVDRVERVIERTKGVFHIAERRMFVAGFDAGGTMALRLAMRCPGWFAGAVSIGGRIPRAPAPLLHLPRRLPLLLMHGRDSQSYPTDDLCTDLKFLHAASMGASVRQYPCGQEVTTAMLSDMNVWMMQHVTGSPCEAKSCPDNVFN